MPTRLALDLLGPPQLRLDDLPVVLDRRKALALLAYLASNDLEHRGRRHSREVLSALFWPEADQASAFASLRHTLWDISRKIGEGWLDADRESIALRPDSRVALDLARFESLQAEARRKTEPQMGIPLLAEAAALYRDHFLSGFSLKDSAPFSDWAQGRSEILRSELGGLLRRLLEDHLSLGQLDQALAVGQRLVWLDPLDELAQRSLMDLYWRSDQQTAALRQYEGFERALRREMSLDPQPETRAIYRQIRKGERYSYQPAHPAQGISPRHNLPHALTRFLGREAEKAEIASLLLGNRLVTISGPGGIGKTRLAIEVGHQMMSQFPDGVWIIALEGLSSGSQVPPALAAVFGLREGPETAPVLDLSRNYFRSRKALLILDNCEHLLESCAALTKTLLEACPELRILVTSREVLGVSGEAQFPLPPLKTPGEGGHESLDVLSAYESIQLFADRAALARPGFALIAENVGPIGDICQKLDGIPLAIELAAARADALQVVEIRAGLGQYFSLLSSSERIPGPRQQSLRACLDWSWGLLAAHEGEFLRRLSIFVGGWTLEAAQAVCAGEGILPHAVRDLLTQLVRKSLLVVQEKDGRSRYRLLEPIRQYALEKLLETGETAQLHERHLDYLIQVAEQGYVELRGPDDLVWMKWLEAEQDNFRAALAWSLESLDADPQRALQLSGALQDFWDASGALKEGRGWLREALQKAPATPTLWRVRALNGDGLLCIRLGQEDAARPPLEAALAMARQLDDTTQLIISLLYYADTQRNPGEFRKYMAECLALARERDDRYHMAYAMGWDVFWFSADESVALRTLARALEIADGVGNARLRALLLWVYSGKLLLSGSYGLGISMAEEGLRLSELLGDKHTAAHCLLTLGRAASRQGRFEEAVGYEERSLRIFSDLSDTECHLRALFALAWCDFLTGDLDAAEEKTQECLSISRGLGTDYLFMTSRYLLALGQIATSRGDDREARGFLLEAFDSLDPKMDPVMLAEFLEGVCALPSLTPEGSARLLGKAGAIREAQGFVIPPSEQHLVNPVVERLQAQLSSEAYESARAAGAALTNEEAVQDAIEALQAMTGG